MGIKSGFVMFLAFIFFGLIPLLGYVILPFADPAIAWYYLLGFAVIVTCFALFLLGAIRSIYGVTKWYRNGLETLILGVVCAGIAFGVSTLVKTSFGVTSL